MAQLKSALSGDVVLGKTTASMPDSSEDERDYDNYIPGAREAQSNAKDLDWSNAEIEKLKSTVAQLKSALSGDSSSAAPATTRS